MLLAILIISLLAYTWSLFSKYLSSEDDLAKIEDVAKFNEQFTNYDRNDVMGYEIVSLVNKVIDYNYRQSNEMGSKNDKNYVPITITIDIVSKDKIKNYSKDNNFRMFGLSNVYKYNHTTFNNSILDEAKKIEKQFGGADNASKMAKKVSTFEDQGKSFYYNAMKYYEYIEFKRSVFESRSNRIQYNNSTGRITNMEFVFTGTIR